MNKSRLLQARAALQRCTGRAAAMAAIGEYLDAKAEADQVRGSTNLIEAPVPPGASAGDWDTNDPHPWRFIYGPERYVDISRQELGKFETSTVMVCAFAHQRADGTFLFPDDADADDFEPGVELLAIPDKGTRCEPTVLNATDARELAANLIKAADEVDGWTSARTVA